MTPTFDERAEWFDEHYRSTRGRVRRTLVLERLLASAPAPPASVLDLGGGSGAIAIPLAEAGHRVTLLDPSEAMLGIAERRAAEAGVEVNARRGGVEDLGGPVSGPFDIVACHAVLLYLDDPKAALSAIRGVVTSGAILSLLEKNRDALAVRPGLAGDYAEALRVLDDPVATGNLGIENRSHPIATWHAWLVETGWRPTSWVGIRLFSDLAPDDLGVDAFQALLELERRAGGLEPYRSVSRLVHIAAIAV